MPASVVDIGGSLQVIAAAFKDLQQENERLKQELEEVRKQKAVSLAEGNEDNSKKFANNKSSSGELLKSESKAVVSQMHRAFAQDERGLIDEERNTQRARLQSMIAEFDPEETGDWAHTPITPEMCRDWATSGKIDVSDATLRGIVANLQKHCNSMDPPVIPTSIQLINLTSVEQLEEVFGDEGADIVMRLQDTVIDRITDKLLMAGNPNQTASPDTMSPMVWLMSPSLWWTWLRSQTRNDIVEVVGTFLVIANTVFLGISADRGNDAWNGWDYISSGFAAAFSIELLIRMCLCGSVWRFFMGESRLWHIFDTVLVGLMLLDIVTLVVHVSAINTRMLTTLRLLRLLRLTRMARLARVGIFNELTYMIRGIEAGTSTLFWAFVLFLFVDYVGAVLVTMTIGTDTGNLAFETYASIHFGSVGRSMFTLFRCFTGDCSAYDGRPLAYALLDRYGNLTIVVYWLALMLVTFGLFNVMIANFLQNSQRAAQFNDVERRRILKRERKMVHDKTQELLSAIIDCVEKKHNEGAPVTLTNLNISRELWRCLVADEKVKNWLDDMGCDDGLRRKLFDKIDVDGNGLLSCAELVHGVVDLLRGRFDNFEALMPLVKSVHNRLLKLEGSLALRFAAEGYEI
mmetsp:Transcript_106004/g.304808  ORF Transcript_106004/g.304808 Transcript_106004/m.304808 type:complete len:631 (-) Transcript_106004:119-2011(-)